MVDHPLPQLVLTGPRMISDFSGKAFLLQKAPAITDFLLFGQENGRTALPNDKHHAQLLKLDFRRRISDLMSDEIVDKLPPISELMCLFFVYGFHRCACRRSIVSRRDSDPITNWNEYRRDLVNQRFPRSLEHNRSKSEN